MACLPRLSRPAAKRAKRERSSSESGSCVGVGAPLVAPMGLDSPGFRARGAFGRAVAGPQRRGEARRSKTARSKRSDAPREDGEAHRAAHPGRAGGRGLAPIPAHRCRGRAAGTRRDGGRLAACCRRFGFARPGLRLAAARVGAARWSALACGSPERSRTGRREAEPNRTERRQSESENEAKGHTGRSSARYSRDLCPAAVVVAGSGRET